MWRFDRMATVCDPGSGRVTASFAGVAKHYGVSVAICPPRRGNRKGVVEKVNHTAAQRWWRTLADEVTVEAAQASVDRFARVRGDTRLRATADGRSSVAVVAKAEPLAPVPAVPYPVIVSETRTASRQALVSYRGNRYSVPPELAAAPVVVSHPVGGEFVDIATTSGIVVARHRLAADGLGVMVRDSGHVIALDAAAMATAATGRPHRRKERIPPGPAAKAAAAQLLQQHGASTRRRPILHSINRFHRHRPVRLRAGRPEKDPPMTPTPRTPKTTTVTTEESPSAAASRYQQLRSHLAELKLHAAAEALPAVLDQATAEGLSLTVALERLLAVEVEASTARRLAGRLRFACLPTPATLADFDVDAAAGIDRKLIDELGTCRYLESATNILLIGPPGAG